LDTSTADTLLSFSGIMSTMFEWGPGSTKYAVYQNESSRSFYNAFRSLGEEMTHDRKRVLCLQDVLDSCLWTDPTQKEEMNSQVHSLTTEDGEVSFSCRRAKANSNETEEEVWLRMSFRCTTSPFSSDVVILVNEYDVTAEAVLSSSMSSALEGRTALNQVLASISGELRTPLNGIIGASLLCPSKSVPLPRTHSFWGS
jgi:hypothetical protein